jgi:hypothetical protein
MKPGGAVRQPYARVDYSIPSQGLRIWLKGVQYPIIATGYKKGGTILSTYTYCTNVYATFHSQLKGTYNILSYVI